MTSASDRPLIGLTGRRKTASQLVGTPEVLHDLEGDWYFADYARGVLEAGGLPVHLPLDVPPELFTGRLDGMLFSGGADIDSTLYGKPPAQHDDDSDTVRDRFEIDLYRAAVARELPVLGICRGIQLVTVAAGGTLHQHVPEHAAFDRAPTTLLHEVEIEIDSILGSLYGPSLAVNSLHHQTAAELGTGFRVTARHNGSIEGIEHTTLPIVAVQWHPEMLPTRSSDPIFAWLVDAARTRR